MIYQISNSAHNFGNYIEGYKVSIDVEHVNDIPVSILNCLDEGYTYANVDLNQFKDLIYHMDHERLRSVSSVLIKIDTHGNGDEFEILTFALNYLDCLSEVMHRKMVRGLCHIVLAQSPDPAWSD